MLYQKKIIFPQSPVLHQKKKYFFGPPVVQKKYMISPSLIATQKKVWQRQVPNVPLVFFKQISLYNISLFFFQDRDITIAGSSDIWKENHQESLESDLVSLFLVFAFVAITSVLVALFSNGLAFLVFFKKPVFRKILSNR